MQSIKLIVILYWRELYFREARNSRILAKIKFSRKCPDLQYTKVGFKGVYILWTCVPDVLGELQTEKKAWIPRYQDQNIL